MYRGEQALCWDRAARACVGLAQVRFAVATTRLFVLALTHLFAHSVTMLMSCAHTNACACVTDDFYRDWL